MFLEVGFGVLWWGGGWAILVHEKGCWPGDLGAEVLLNAVILGDWWLKCLNWGGNGGLPRTMWRGIWSGRISNPPGFWRRCVCD